MKQSRIFKKKIIFICTANSCRSQIAHGLMKNIAGYKFDVFSAGVNPTSVHPAAIKVMNEIGIDISSFKSNHINDYLDKFLDIAITVCDMANDSCPVFPENIIKYHWSINDPSINWDPNNFIIKPFRDTRNKIKNKIENFLINY